MVSIVPADEALRKRLGLNPDELCLAAYDGGELIGRILYRTVKDEVFIDDVTMDDGSIADGLIRAALNAVSREGVKTAVCRKGSLFDLFGKTGLTRDGESRPVEIRIDIERLFNKDCKN